MFKPCPKCGGREFRVQVTFSGSICILVDPEDPEAYDVTDSEPTDSAWEDLSFVDCRDCDWSGTMADIETDTIPAAMEPGDAFA